MENLNTSTMYKEKFEKLAFETSKPCVTISMNTHRTHPENIQDAIVLRKLCNDTEERLLSKFGKRPILPLLEKLEQISEGDEISYNLDSLHIFLSNETKEIVKSTWAVNEDKVHISETFAIGSLLKTTNKDFEYLILLLSQDSVKLFVALNNSIIGEIKNDYFPFTENTHPDTDPKKVKNPKTTDNMLRKYYTKVDKAVLKVYNQTGLTCLAICTSDNYGRLMQAADKPSIYAGYTSMDFNMKTKFQIAARAWEIMKEQQRKRERTVIDEMKEAMVQGTAITDLFKIYLAVKEGRGDLLIAYNDFNQRVKKSGASISNLVNNTSHSAELEDITTELARLVIIKKGRVVYTDSEEIKSLGDVVLKLRY